jgi:5-methylcytosine-specific restriction endonuclease McrA
MSRAYISSELRQFVSERANLKCEYCLISQQETFIPHQPDHIIAEQHGGQTNGDNLALACVDCNRFKGPNKEKE